MNALADSLETLRRLGSDPTSGVHLKPPASDEAIRRMQEEADSDLGEPIPDDYLALLRVTNGVQINGAYFRSAEDMVPLNLDWDRPEIIVLGSSGNVETYVFDRRDRRFHTAAMFDDHAYESFDTFGGLLADVMRQQLTTDET